MPLVIPDDFYQVAMQCTQTGTGQKAVVTFGIFSDAVDFNGMADGVDLAWRTDLMPLVGSSWVHDKATWATQEGTVRERFYTLAGGDASAESVGLICHLIHKRTLQPGRAHRGRWFMPGVPEGVVGADGILTSGRQADWNSALTDVLGDFAAAGGVMVLLHNQDPTPGAPVAPLPTGVTSLVISPKVGVQRRRLRGG